MPLSGPEIYTSNPAARLERRVLARLGAELELTLAQLTHLIIASGNGFKTAALAQLVQAVSGVEINYGHNGNCYCEGVANEPHHPDAAQVAWSKVRQKRVDLGSVITLLESGGAKLAVAGGDVNAFYGKEGKRLLTHKLSRDEEKLGRSLSPAEWAASDQLLRERYSQEYLCQDFTQRWEIGLCIENGKTFSSKFVIEVVSGPLDAELLEMFIQASHQSGLDLHSNTQLALFEAVVLNGKVRSISIYPSELERAGYCASQLASQQDAQRFNVGHFPGLSERELIEGVENSTLARLETNNLAYAILRAIISNVIDPQFLRV
ncbi:MAG: hypothetical protein GF381_01690 [Candidatus Pacebacteria bacterium]|nr:hypothetical protein [Candidatus Paceibacterota bacterium]